MKKKNTKKENKFLIFILIIIIFCLCLFFLIKYITKEIEEYKLYDDYTKANQVMLLSFNKNFDIFFTSIRAIQASNYDKKLSKGDIIFDFANYHMIPILDYMKKPTNNEILITNFSLFTDFLANYNMATIDNRENILIKQKNNTYYVYKNKKYKYSIKKEVISREALEELYNQYLESIKELNVSSNFINRLLKETKISKKYTYHTLLSKINKEYLEFYQEYEELVLDVIGKDIGDFVDYLSYIVVVDPERKSPPVLTKKLQTKTLRLDFEFTRLDRIYVPYSKYYKYSYQLNLNSIWEQLKQQEFPMLYC